MPVGLVCVLGALVPADDVEYPKGAIGWLRGYGVYETLWHYPGGFFMVDMHLDRLQASAGLLRIPMPDRALLRKGLEDWAQATGFTWARGRIVLLEGEGAPWWMIEGEDLGGPRPPLEQRALKIWVAAQCIPPPPLGAAKTISRVSYELAALEAKERGTDDAIMPTIHGQLAESTRASVFWREGDQLYTPPLSLGILPGVTRSLLLTHLPRAGQAVSERAVPLEHLFEADEVFVTSTVRGIAPVVLLRSEGRPDRVLEVGPGARRSHEVFQGLLAEGGYLASRA